MSIVRPEDEEGAALPAFSLRELQLRKAESRNTVTFGAPARASVLLRVLHPKTHAYEERDRRWLHLLQAVAAVPSRRVDTLTALVRLALQLLPSRTWRLRLHTMVRATLADADAMNSATDFPKRALASLQLKERVAQFLREWLADPVEGFALWKEHVVGGLHLDDLVATPVGAGYLRGYRRDDGFCVVLYPWGHGFIRLQEVQRLEQAIVAERKKRKLNQFLVLEHQHLYEEVESLLENYPPEDGASSESGEPLVKLTPEGVAIEEYEKLVEALQEDEPVDAEVLQRDLSFVRRVQALANRTKHQRQRQHDTNETPKEPAADDVPTPVEEKEDCDEDMGDGAALTPQEPAQLRPAQEEEEFEEEQEQEQEQEQAQVQEQEQEQEQEGAMEQDE